MIQYVADGLVAGSILALGAAGLTLVYSILRFANFAHGDLVTWGAYLALTFLGFLLAVAGGDARPIAPFSFGWPLLVALLLSALATGGLALLLHVLLFKRLGRAAALTRVIARFGAALALRNLLFFLYGGVPEYYSREIQVAVPLLPRDVLGGFRVTPDQLFTLGFTALLVFALHLFLTRTNPGRAMRAVSHNPDLARVVGIDVDAVIAWTWAVGGALAAAAGVLSGLTIQLRPTLGFDLLLPLFSAAILGGIGSVYGAVAGGFIVGMAEALSVPLIGAEYRAAVAFLLLIAILLVRPTGLFGERA